MMKHQPISLHNDNGTEVLAQAPLIVSASRATDIPAFCKRMKEFGEKRQGFLQNASALGNNGHAWIYTTTTIGLVWATALIWKLNVGKKL